MRRTAPALVPALALISVITLAGCGPESAKGPTQPDRPRAPPPNPQEMALRLTALPAPYNAADLENGRRAFARCRSCHTVTDGGPNMTGPNLYGVFGRKAGTAERYNYSAALRAADFTWDAERLDHWLQNPRNFLPGNKMTFPGLPDATDRRDIIAFIEVQVAPPVEPAAAATP